MRPKRFGIFATSTTIGALCALYLLLTGFYQVFAAGPSNTVPKFVLISPEITRRPFSRSLHFPKDKCVGLLYLQTWISAEKPPKDRTMRATGTINIPANTTTRLEAGEIFFRDPSVLKDLEADSLDVLVLRLSSMADAEEGLVDNALGHMAHLKGLQAIYIDRSDASDVGLSKLGTLTNLRLIEAGNCLVKGRALKALTNLKELRTLRLPSAALEQSNLKYLASMPKLDQLSLTRTSLTSEGLKYVSACQGLKVLQLNQNKGIVDPDMRYLLPLKKLMILELGNTSVTMAGLAKLQGLDLMSLRTPLGHYSAADMAKLHKIFPRSEIAMAHESAIQANSEDITNLLGPISRGKGL